MSARIVHFEIAVDNIDRAIAFYTNTFGWKITKWDGPVEYWMVDTGPKEEMGINGGMMLREMPATDGEPNAFVCTVVVENIDTILASITENGGSIAKAKHEIPTVGFMAYCKDTENNVFGVMQSIMAS